MGIANPWTHSQLPDGRYAVMSDPGITTYHTPDQYQSVLNKGLSAAGRAGLTTEQLVAINNEADRRRQQGENITGDDLFAQRARDMGLQSPFPEDHFAELLRAEAGNYRSTLDQQSKYVESQPSQAFGNFAKFALPAAALAGGIAFAHALFGAGTTGVAAGGSSGTGLGSIFSGFSGKAALGGALKGAAGGLAGGGDFSDILKGAALGGVTGGYGNALGSSLGLSEAGLSGFTGALTGASGGVASGNLKSALLGGVLGGAGGYVSAGGNVPLLGQKAGASLDQATGVAGLQGPTQGAGALGSITRAAGGLGLASGGGESGLTGGSMNKLGSLLKVGGALYSGRGEEDANEQIRQQLLSAQGRAEGVLSPYEQAGAGATQQLSQSLAGGFQPQDLTQDPGYQFRLQQGQEALNRQLAASGMSQSGAAMKAAQEYGQGLADQTYDDAYRRWLAQNSQLAGLSGQGQLAATGLGNIYRDSGGIEALTTAANRQNKNRMYSQVLSGLGGLF